MFKRSTLMIFALAILTLAFTTSATAQTEQGNMGMSAGIGMPAGLVEIAGMVGGSTGQVNIGYGASTHFLFMMSERIQLEVGLGFISASTSTEGGEDPDPNSILSLAAGGKYFFRIASVVSPYLGAGFSFTKLPTLESGGEDRTGSMINFTAFYGLQAFITKDRSVALFIQIGFGYSTLTNDYSGMDNTNSNLNFGGSAVGGVIYM